MASCTSTTAIPAGGGFEEGIPLLCLHPIPHSGRIFTRFLAVAGGRRSVFAPDLPGFGDSDPPSPKAGVAEHAAAIGDFLETMRLRQIDLLGHGFGAASRRGAGRYSAGPGPTPRTGLAAAIRRRRRAAADGADPGWWTPARGVAPRGGLLRAGGAAGGGERRTGGAVCATALRLRPPRPPRACYQLRPRLAQLTAPLLVLRLGAEVSANKGQPRDLPARTRFVELPERDASLFETAPDVAAQAVESFLR